MIRFWTEKNISRRKIFFRQLRNPAYKIPLAVLMTVTLQNHAPTFRNYIHENFKEVSKFLLENHDEDNMGKLLMLET